MRVLSSVIVHCNNRYPCLLRFTFQSFRPHPRYGIPDHFNRFAVLFSFWNGKLLILSGFAFNEEARLSHPAVSGSLSYGLIVHFQLLSTPLYSDAVTFNYRDYSSSLTWTFTMLIKRLHRRTHCPTRSGNPDILLSLEKYP